MSRGSYIVNEGYYNSPSKDRSFKSFVCSMLVFLIVCVLIYLMMLCFPRKKDYAPPAVENNRNDSRQKELEAFKNEGTSQNIEKTTSTESFQSNEPLEQSDLLPSETTPNSETDIFKNSTKHKESVKHYFEIIAIEDSEPTKSVPYSTKTVQGSSEDYAYSSETTSYEDTMQLEDQFENEITAMRDFTFPSDVKVDKDPTTESTTETPSSTLAVKKLIDDNAFNSTVQHETTETSDQLELISEENDTGIWTTAPGSEFSTLILFEESKNFETVNQINEQTITDDSEERSTLASLYFTAKASVYTVKETSSTLSTAVIDAVPTTIHSFFENGAVKIDTTEAVTEKAIDSTTRKVYQNFITDSRGEINSSTHSTIDHSIFHMNNESEIQKTTPSTKFRIDPVAALQCRGTENSKEECATPFCKLKASTMLNLIDHKVDPCENFYDFACGGLKTENRIDNEKTDTLLGLLYSKPKFEEKFLQHFKGFFDNCVSFSRDYRYVDRMWSMINTIASSPWDQWDVTNLFSFLFQRKAMPFFNIDIGVAEGDTFVVQLNLPGESSLNLGPKEWPLQSQLERKCLRNFTSARHASSVNLNSLYDEMKACENIEFLRSAKNFLDDTLSLLKSPYKISPLASSSIPVDKKTNLETFVEFLERIDVTNVFGVLIKSQRVLSIDALQIRKSAVYQNYVKVSVEELTLKYPYLNWKRLFENVLGSSVPPKSVEMAFVEYFDALFDIFDTSHNNEIIQTVSLYYFLHIYELVVMPTIEETTEDLCLRQATDLMPEVVAAIHSQKFDKKEGARDYVSYSFSLYHELKAQLRLVIENSSLEKSAKKSFQEKLSDIKLIMGSHWVSEVTVHDFHETIEIGDNYLENYLGLVENGRKNLFLFSQNSSISLLQHFIDPFDLKPITFYQNKIIVIPSRLLEDLPNKDYPLYLLNGHVGFHLSKELAKHFTDVGRRFGQNEDDIKTTDGFYKSFVSGLKTMLVMDKGRDLLKQKLEYNINEAVSEISVNDRMSDNMALQLTYDLVFNSQSEEQTSFWNLPWISESYCSDQAFFISLAQEYCGRTSLAESAVQLFESQSLPNPFKVDIMMTNFEEFSKAFKCSAGLRMNPEIDRIQMDTLTSSDYDYNNNYELLEMAN